MSNPKRIYISVDIEGMEGINGMLGIVRGQGDFAVARKRLAEDVNAAVRACYDMGAEEVVVCDGHADCENLLIEDLDERVKLISGIIRNKVQIECIERGFDAMIAFGHAGAGEDMVGVLDHCYMGKKIYNMRLNGQQMNTEAVQNAYLAGCYNVPTVTIIGDDAVCKQMQRHIPNIETVVVKEALSRFAAMSIHPKKARELIYAGVTAGLKNIDAIKAPVLAQPITLEIDYKETNMAQTAALVPGVKHTAPRTVEFTGDVEEVSKMQNLLIVRLTDQM